MTIGSRKFLAAEVEPGNASASRVAASELNDLIVLGLASLDRGEGVADHDAYLESLRRRSLRVRQSH